MQMAICQWKEFISFGHVSVPTMANSKLETGRFGVMVERFVEVSVRLFKTPESPY